jgi:MinD-like ATPase involved in chromosome partitioning or flagellar assembly
VLPALEEAGITVVKRCVDTSELMATATAGTALVAVVDEQAPGFDGEVVRHLLRHDTRTVGVSADGGADERLGRLGVVAVARPDAAEVLRAVQQAVAAAEPVLDPAPARDVVAGGVGAGPAQRGRVIVVWGPAGAPGRTTVAIGLAAAHAARGDACVLVDLDPYGGAVAQHLGVLDEVSGVLAAARLANAGRLDEAAFAQSARRVGDGLVALSGLPRGDRRIEVRPGAVEAILDVAAGFGDVVADTGFGLEVDDIGPSRDRMTLDALALADDVVVVGSAEPTGLSRLARGLVDIAETAPMVPVHVVVNRMRGSLGWSERDITGMVEGYARPASMTFLPFDQQALDRALVAGRSLVEGGDSALARTLDSLAGRLAGQPPNSR